MTQPLEGDGREAEAPPAPAWLAHFTPRSRRLVACLALLATFVFPTTGVGIDLCPIRFATGLPCPGCGVTRGMALLSQAEWERALHMNPWVFVLWPALLFWALTYFLPDRAIATLVQQIARREPLFTNVAKAWLALFTATGLVRLVAFALGVQSPFVH